MRARGATSLVAASALVLSGCVALFGLVAWLVIVPEVRPIDWGAARP